MTHIMVWRGEMPEDGLRGFWHHGILCEDGSVIHYSGMDGMKTLHNAQIQRTSMSTFVTQSQREVHPVRYSKSGYSENEIVKRAESRIGERGYNLVSHNCENFARWCVVGHSKSFQVQGAFLGLGGAVISMVFGGGLLGAALTGIVAQRVWDSGRNVSPNRQVFNQDGDRDNKIHVSIHGTTSGGGDASSSSFVQYDSGED